MLGARLLCSAFLFLATSVHGQTGTSTQPPPSSSSPCYEVCLVEPCDACGAPTGIMSILPIFTSGSILPTGSASDVPSSGAASSSAPAVSILPTSVPSVSILPTSGAATSLAGSTSVPGEMSIPAGETPLTSRPGPVPTLNGTSLSNRPTPTTTVLTTTPGASQSSGVPGSSAVSKMHGQSSMLAAVAVVLGFSWALL